ncbi:conserved hypothetical protein [Gloeothece citriformis PCC 7424]|uniref:DUF2157 domain-containing protein n=1 Tax=Gloeothece citriformis (strain PCC 7424) TaxID=65393 RepID=B7KET0_GLOC7|nr:DUF2157 domain-containing protein [Gloeothece citriformis]ACK69105.1 conserved hypothetical protein [Gloeothece citriformis PCC 7424]
MRLEKEDFDWAAEEGIISPEQAELLWEAFSDRYQEENNNRPRFNFANVAYYFGALIVISAMTWFISLAWESFGGAGMFFVACLYALGFSLTGKNLYFQHNLKIPGGLLFTMAVAMTPLGIYGLQRWSGFWLQGDPGIYRDFYQWIKGSWFFMELGTILTGLIALRFVKFPFLTAPIAFSLWFMSMDLTPLIFGEDDFNYKERALVSFWFGLACLVVAYLIDLRIKRSRGDFSFWLYLFGLMSFWFSLPFLGGGNEWDWFIYGLTNLILMVLSVVLKRRVFMVFGGIGVFSYLSHLSYVVFANSILFPFALTLLGLLIIYLGVLYQCYYQNLARRFDSFIPQELRHLIPKDR